jgi:hypothetical protein
MSDVIRFSADDGDAAGNALDIGYPQSEIDLAEAAEELSALEHPPGQPRRRLDQPVAALGLSVVVGLVVGVAMARAA